MVQFLSVMNYKFAPPMISHGLAFLYDPLVNMTGVGIALQKKILEVTSIHTGGTLLDVGCGTGTFAILAKGAYPKSTIVGLEPDGEVLKIAKNKAHKKNVAISFIQAGAENIPFPDKSFDTIVSSLAFHHFPTPIKIAALKEIHRVLKSKGSFLLVDIGKPKNFFWKIILHIEALVEPKEYIKDNLAGNLPIFLKNAGFRTTETRKPYRGIYFWKATK